MEKMPTQEQIRKRADEIKQKARPDAFSGKWGEDYIIGMLEELILSNARLQLLHENQEQDVSAGNEVAEDLLFDQFEDWVIKSGNSKAYYGILSDRARTFAIDAWEAAFTAGRNSK